MAELPTTYAITSEAACRHILWALQARFRTSRGSTPRLRTTCYDTFDWRLYWDGGVLSAQRTQGKWLIVWKSVDGRIRYQQKTDSLPAFAWDLPPGPFRDALTSVIEMRRLLPMVKTENHAKFLWVLDGAKKRLVRIDIERGTAGAPDKTGSRHPLGPRIHLVPIAGNSKAYGQVVRFVETDLDLRRQESTDLALALAAIGRAPGDYSSKFELSLDPRMRADEAAKRIHRRLLQTIQMNEAGTRRDLDSEFLHDFRVAVRRTRTCLAQIREVFPEETVDHFRREFSWLGRVSGPKRDLDVHLLKVDEYEASLDKKVQHHLAPLRQFLQVRQRIEQDRLAKALQSARYQTLILSWKGFLEETVPEKTKLPNARRPILRVASERIELRFRRVLMEGVVIDSSSSAKALHQLRIECKKLRYPLEFFRSLYKPEDLAPLVKDLKTLQDNLGDFNDLRVQHAAMKKFGRQMVKEGMATGESLKAIRRFVNWLGVRQAKERKGFDKRFTQFSGTENRERLRRLVETRKRIGV